MKRLLPLLLAPLLLLGAMPPPADAAPRRAAAKRPALGEAAIHGEAYRALPARATVAVRLLDDSPENVRLAGVLRDELRRTGLAAGGGIPLTLTVETDAGYVTGPDTAGSPAFLGTVRATLDDPATGERLWEAEAIYRTTDGDIPAGARALAPALVRSIGRTVTDESVTLPSMR